MNKNILIVLGGAVLAAVLVAMLVQVTLGGKSKTTGGMPSEETLPVLVATKDLPAGYELKEGDTEWAQWPKSQVFKKAVVQLNEDEKPLDAVSGRLERPIFQGQAVLTSSILKEGEGNYVVARLQAGERAISMKVKAESMVAGFIRPGSFVDVILTYKQRINVDNKESIKIKQMVQANLSNLATETILENVRVLAIDQKAEYDKGDKISVGKTVTLAVPARDAEKLALATEMGTITLAMRGVGDEEANPEGPTISDARLTKIDDEIFQKFEEMKEERDVVSGHVKIYSGSNVEEVPVR